MNNSLALGGIAAASFGALAQDSTISRRVVSDSLMPTFAWTTLAAAKSIHDSLVTERAFDTAVSRNVGRIPLRLCAPSSAAHPPLVMPLRPQTRNSSHHWHERGCDGRATAF